MDSAVDWAGLSREVEAVSDPRTKGWNFKAKLALEKLIGEEWPRSAVDHYVGGLSGAELAASVLADMKPLAAAERCLEILQDETDQQRRLRAAIVLGFVADRRVYDEVLKLLRDPDEAIQDRAALTIDALFYRGALKKSDYQKAIEASRGHPNECVRKVIQAAANVIASRTPLAARYHGRITADLVLLTARIDAENNHADLSAHRVCVSLEADGWHVDFELKESHGQSSGPHYIMDAATGRILTKHYEQRSAAR